LVWHDELVQLHIAGKGLAVTSKPLSRYAHPFGSIRGQSPLLRDSEYRLLIPSSSLFDPYGQGIYFSEQDLDAIYAEVIRRRLIWRIHLYLKLAAFLWFFTWTI
jgi:hypothetical protein